MNFARFFRVLASVTLLLWSAKAGPDDPPGSVPLRMILAASEAEAKQLLERLRSGADFAVLAREKSIDPTAEDGGSLGSIDPSSLRAELRDAIARLRPGETSGVIRLPSGFAILRIVPAAELYELNEVSRARSFQMKSEAAVRFSFDISGLNEAEAALASWSKPADWYQDLQVACDTRKSSLAAVNARIDTLVAAIGPATAPLDAMSLRVARGQLYAYTGDMDHALTWWDAAYRAASRELPQAVPYLDELLGIGYLHKAAFDNDVFRKPGELCLLSLQPEWKYPRSESAAKAVEFLLKTLSQKPGDIETRWLLNLGYMSLGRYPEGLPKEFLIPPSAFASGENAGHFRDVAAQSGLNIFGMAAGLIVDDFDGDGLWDVVVSSFDMCAPMRFYHNNGDGTFSDKSAKAGLTAQLGGLNLMQADYNNDGCMDILVTRGGWEVPQRLSLLRNNCDGTFTGVTKTSGLLMAVSSQTAVWTDIDNDGYLDLFVGNENGPNQLFRNQGDGTFTNISHAAGVDLTAFTKGVASADYDRDGWADLYVSNYRGDNVLYHNNGNGTFTSVGKQAGVTGTGHGFATWFFDYDNDGWPDLFATSYYMSTEETARTYMGLPHNGGTLKLYRNLGNGAFRDVTAEVNLDKVFMPMGANFGDIDNDGFLDIYMGTGNPAYSSLVPNVLLHNKGGRSFVDITQSSGTGELHKGHAVAFADIDNDGDEDLLTVIGGATPGDSHAFRLFENPGHGNDWISIRLHGMKANRAGIGARIQVKLEGRSVYRTAGSGGSFGASPIEQHIGLGKAAEIERIEVIWPGDPVPQTILRPAKNQAIEITQFAREYKVLKRNPVRLGGAGK
jgi:tetratricopeptide (TPR) repeat protein